MKAPRFALTVLLCSCATLPEPAGGEQGLPNAVSGPFRALVSTELGNSRSAPNGLDDGRDYGRDVAVIDVDGDPDTLEVAAYVAAGVKENGKDPTPDSPTRAIVRYGALDGRSFDRAAVVVLTADQAWEGGVMAAPAVIRIGNEIFLYYAAAGGVGFARSSDGGMTFSKTEGAVLGPADGWEQRAVPASPGVVALADGSFRMFYEVALPSGGSAIGEAVSSDGVSFARAGDAPALAPGADWDQGSVGSPFPMLATSGDERAILRVYYGARDAAGVETIGLAARYLEGEGDAPLRRSVSPVFGTGKPLASREPCVVAFGGFALLYATQKSSTNDAHPAIAVGVAPATAALPPPDPK